MQYQLDRNSAGDSWRASEPAAFSVVRRSAAAVGQVFPSCVSYVIVASSAGGAAFLRCAERLLRFGPWGSYPFSRAAGDTFYPPGVEYVARQLKAAGYGCTARLRGLDRAIPEHVLKHHKLRVTGSEARWRGLSG